MSAPRKKAAALTGNERQTRLREQREAEGWFCLKSVWLEPEAAAKLAAWIERGESATAVVNRLLARSKP
jgi:hypothetical protein